MQQINVIVTPKVKQTISVTVNGVAMSVVNSDGSYSTTHYSGTPFIIPNITVTDSDGSTYSYPSVKDVTCTPPVGVDVENSDESYTQHINNGATLVLPDTVVKNTAGTTILTQPSATNTGVIADCRVVNSDASYDENVPAETTHSLADVTHTDTDGSPKILPGMTPMVCTPGTPPGEQFYVLFPSLYKSTVDITVDASSAGTYAYEQSANTSSILYKVNGGVVTMPFTVVNGDVLTVVINKTDENCLSVVELTNISVTPYTFSSGNYASAYPPAFNDTYVKATSVFDPSFFPASNTVNTAKNLTGNWDNQQWLSGNGQPSNQRFHIDLGSAKIIGKIYYENAHYSGNFHDAGIRDFTIWGSNNPASFADLVYTNDAGWTQLGDVSQSYFEPHKPVDAVDPKYIMVQNQTAYRYYALKIANNWGNSGYMGIRRIELQE